MKTIVLYNTCLPPNIYWRENGYNKVNNEIHYWIAVWAPTTSSFMEWMRTEGHF